MTPIDCNNNNCSKVKIKVIPRQTEVALGVPGRLRPRFFSTFGTTRVVGRQPNAPVAFAPGEIPGTHFQRLSRPQGTWFCRKEPRKKIPSDTTGDRSRDLRTSRIIVVVIIIIIIKPTRCTNFTNLFCRVTLHVSDSSSVHHQEFFHCTLSNGICHTGL